MSCMITSLIVTVASGPIASGLFEQTFDQRKLDQKYALNALTTIYLGSTSSYRMMS